MLTQRELNRALLARQLLLKRSTLSIPLALERMGGIQNQYAPNAYIRLWSSLEDFRRGQVTRALERRTVVQGTLMRTTIHLVSAREYWPYAAGLRRAVREWQLRVDKATPREMRRRAAKLRAALLSGPVPAKELDGRAQLWENVVRAPPSGTWERRRADHYALAEQWVGPGAVSEAEGQQHLIRSYLRGFGPAALEDVSSWAGVPVRLLAPAIERLQLRRFRDERGRELLDLPRAPLPPADTPAPVRFLPWWDAVMLVHARRTGILPEEYRPVVFDNKNPPSVPTFLIDGRAAGAWRYDDDGSSSSPTSGCRGGRSGSYRRREPTGRLHERRRIERDAVAQRKQDADDRVTPDVLVEGDDLGPRAVDRASAGQRVVGGDETSLGESGQNGLVVADVARLVGVDKDEVELALQACDRLDRRAHMHGDAIRIGATGDVAPCNLRVLLVDLARVDPAVGRQALRHGQCRVAVYVPISSTRRAARL